MNALIPGLSRVYVSQSVPLVAARALPHSDPGISTTGFSRSKLYSIPSRCCFSGNDTLKSKLKSLLNDDAHGKIQPIRFLYLLNCASGAREIAQNITS